MPSSADSGTKRDAVRAMPYRRLGQTELTLPTMGFGASPLGGVFGHTDVPEGWRAVQLAIDAGITYFDVSPYYGLTLAEERLGAALERRRHEVVLATKCGRYGVEEFDFSAQRVCRSIEESLRRLRTDHVDLLLAHDVEFGDVGQIIAETIPTLRRLQDEGKTRFIGISGYSLRTLMRIAEAVPLDCVLSYCRSNLLSDEMDRVLAPFAEQRGIGLVNASPLHMGLLTEQGAPAWHPAPRPVHEAARRAAELCRREGVELPSLALRYCLDHTAATSTLVGMATGEDVRRNLRAWTAPVDADLLRQVRETLAPVFNWVWACGRAENQDPVHPR